MSTFNQLVDSEKPVLIDFYADWCGPCKMMPPILKQVANELGDQVRIIKIDVDKNPVIAGKLNIQGVPTLMIYKNGSQQWRQSGVLPAPQLVNLLQQYM